MTLQFRHYSECNILENEAVFSFTYDTNFQKTGLALDFQVCITSFNLQLMTTQRAMQFVVCYKRVVQICKSFAF